jgi:hypothetical protein
MTDLAVLAALGLAGVVVYSWVHPRAQSSAGKIVSVAIQWLAGAVYFVCMFRMAWQLWSQ